MNLESQNVNIILSFLILLHINKLFILNLFFALTFHLYLFLLLYYNKLMSDKSSLNIQDIAINYIQQLVKQCNGMKTIVFDAETKILFSLVMTKSSAIKEEIFMFEELKNLKTTNKNMNVKAIFFIKPSEENISMLVPLLKTPIYGEYFMNFTNVVSEEQLRKLANADEFSSIKNMEEVYLDYYVINKNLFHFNFESSSINQLYSNINKWKQSEHFMINEMTKNLFAYCISMRSNPVIKYIKKNELSSLLANKLNEMFSDNRDVVGKNCGNNPNSMIFIYDRREDPITPLLTQWTYQAMIHDNYKINNNIIDFQNEKVVLSDLEDDFLLENKEKEFGEITNIINDKVMEYAKNNKDEDKLDTFKDMIKYLENLPTLKKQSMEVTKHSGIIFDLIRRVNEKKLLEISSLEQDIACSSSKKDHMNKIISIIKNPIYAKHTYEKVKLYLLFCLRYEDDQMAINTLKEVMSENNMHDYMIVGDLIIKNFGNSSRCLDLFGNKDFLSKHLNKITSVFKDVPNVFTQHTSLLSNTLKKIMDKKPIPEIETLNSTGKEKIENYTVFCIGGGTYEEHRDINNIAKTNKINLTFGTSHMLNPTEFIEMIENIKGNK